MSEFRGHVPSVQPPACFGASVFQVEAGGGGPASGFQWPLRFSASATSFGM